MAQPWIGGEGVVGGLVMLMFIFGYGAGCWGWIRTRNSPARVAGLKRPGVVVYRGLRITQVIHFHVTRIPGEFQVYR